MAHFEKNESGYTITNAGQTVQLTPEQTYELLRWLYDRRDELTTSLHPQAKQEIPDWLSASQKKATQMPTMRYLEIRLYQEKWSHLDELKAAIPALYLQYEGHM